MGQLINRCVCDRCESNESKDEEEDYNSDDSFSDNNPIKQSHTIKEIPLTNSDIPLNTDSLVRAYNCSPYDKYEELSILGEGAYGLVKKYV